jgi:hypothetical protein
MDNKPKLKWVLVRRAATLCLLDFAHAGLGEPTSSCMDLRGYLLQCLRMLAAQSYCPWARSCYLGALVRP